MVETCPDWLHLLIPCSSLPAPADSAGIGGITYEGADRVDTRQACDTNRGEYAMNDVSYCKENGCPSLETMSMAAQL